MNRTIKIIFVAISLVAVVFIIDAITNLFEPNIEITYEQQPIADFVVEDFDQKFEPIFYSNIKIGRDKIIKEKQMSKTDSLMIEALRNKIIDLSDSLHRVQFERDSIIVLYMAEKLFIAPDSSFGGLARITQENLPFNESLKLNIINGWQREKTIHHEAGIMETAIKILMIAGAFLLGVAI